MLLHRDVWLRKCRYQDFLKQVCVENSITCKVTMTFDLSLTHLPFLNEETSVLTVEFPGMLRGILIITLTPTSSRSPMSLEGGTTLTSLTRDSAMATRRFSLLLPFGYACGKRDEREAYRPATTCRLRCKQREEKSEAALTSRGSK